MSFVPDAEWDQHTLEDHIQRSSPRRIIRLNHSYLWDGGVIFYTNDRYGIMTLSVPLTDIHLPSPEHERKLVTDRMKG